MIIYRPKGKAREYSPLAVNLFTGCSHGCRYCYVPELKRTTREDYIRQNKPRKDVLRKLEQSCRKHYKSREHVQLSFVGDPYDIADIEERVTRDALRLLYKYKIPVSILTKAGSNCLIDLKAFEAFGEHIMVGASLVFYDERKSREWEPFAATPRDRLIALAALKEAGVRTWASFEPVIEPSESLRLIQESLDFVDYYKIGKLNNYENLDRDIDWKTFAMDAIDMLNKNGKRFYIKKDLREAAKIEHLLTENQMDMDDMKVPHF